jgi:hypothetical protein
MLPSLVPFGQFRLQAPFISKSIIVEVLPSANPLQHNRDFRVCCFAMKQIHGEFVMDSIIVWTQNWAKSTVNYVFPPLLNGL